MTIQNTEVLKTGAETFDIKLTDEHTACFSRYYHILMEWNQKMNLTAIKNERDVIIKHFIDSLSVIPFLPDGCSSLIDVGTGAGFPGIPIKIVKKDTTVTLLDSQEKRVRFLDKVIQELSCKRIQAIHGRAEEVSRTKIHREVYDVGIARAVASISVLSEYILPFVRIGGFFIAMKGSEIEEELKVAENAVSILGGQIKKVHSFSLPIEKMERNIILIEKVRQTPLEYPRKSGKPTKSPLK